MWWLIGVKRSLEKVLGNNKNLLLCKCIKYDLCNNVSAKYLTNGVVESEGYLKEGGEIEGFVVNRVSKVPEFHLTAYVLKHSETGADYLHLFRKDTNNAFSIGFRTTPLDSTGLPHILEHMVTCGSEKYPCRDPYFKMLNRSMATFMNAMTGPDFTIYPFSTQNQSDYMNLMSVYLDAVFHPLLRKTDFSQEAWRLEHRITENHETPIVFKGVVLNEMKGFFSDNENIFLEAVMNNILPSHTYSVVSGGDPLEIPKLEYQNIVDFHKDHYHPSNSRLYSYGDFPLRDTLKLINDNYLSGYKENKVDYSVSTQVPSEEIWSCPRIKSMSYRFDKLAADPDKQASLAVSHLCCDINNGQEVFALSILSQLLVQGANAAFYETLIEPNVGAGFSPVTGYNNQTKSTYFSVGLQGLNLKDFPWVVETFNKTVDQVIEKGFSDKHVEAVLHNIEIGIKHQSSDFGLALLFAITPPWIHETDIIEQMRVNDRMDRFKKALKDNPRYLQDLVAKYLKYNPHRLVLSVSPDSNYEKNLQEKEDDLLKSKLNKMSKDEMNEVWYNGIQLNKEQGKPEDILCLPTLKLSDLKKEIEKVEFTKLKVSSVPVQISLQPTNGLLYFHGVLGVEKLSDNLKNILPLFCFVADKMGTKNIDYREFEQQIQLSSGGMNFKYHNVESPRKLNTFEEGLVISSHCLDRNVGKMFELWSQLFTEVSLEDVERFSTLLTMYAADSLNGIFHSGHLYAMSSSSSFVSPSGKRSELCGGLTFVKKLQELSQQSDFGETLALIKSVASEVLCKETLRVAINSSPDGKEDAVKQLTSFCEKINGNRTDCKPYFSTDVLSTSVNEGTHLVFPSSVSFASKSIMTVPYNHQDFAPLRILCRLMTMKYFLPEVREKGGSYGAGANISTGGVLSFYSYKDPSPAKTFTIFDKSLDWVTENKITKTDIEEAKLGTFQSVDAPVPPGQKGIKEFLYNIDHDNQQKHRLKLLKVTKSDLQYVASKYLDTNMQTLQGRALLGPENKHVLLRDGEKWTVIH